MRKWIYITLGTIVGILLIYMVINFFDLSPRPGEDFTLNDLRPAGMDTGNGFYILWGLGEPPEVDVTSESYAGSIRELFASPEDMEEKVKAFDHGRYRKNFDKYYGDGTRLKYPNLPGRNWIHMVESQSEAVRKGIEVAAVPLERYETLVHTPKVEDFISPHYYAPIPNLLAWLRVARLHLASLILKGLDGDWENAAKGLLLHLDFGKRAAAHSRVLIVNLIAKAVTADTLGILAGMLNHPECPETVFQIILDGMPPITYEEYGSANAFICECLSAYSIIDSVRSKKDMGFTELTALSFLPIKPFLHAQRTKDYFTRFYRYMVRFDKQAPFQWEGRPLSKTKDTLKTETPFWWLQNPLGKVIYDIAIPNMNAVVFKGYRLRAYYDMTRILAEYRLKQSPDQPVLETLKQLETYKTADPCTGKPYAWNEAKRVLYSFGIDRKDHKGKEDRTKMWETDVAIPIKKTAKQNTEETTPGSTAPPGTEKES